MIFRVLGPLSLAHGGDAVVLPPSKVASLLAALLVRPNEVVSIGTLQEAVWGDDQPAAARAALQTCAMRLRQLFVRHAIGTSSIETVPGGYRFNASGETADLLRFREMTLAAEAQSDPGRRLVLLEGALALWRGPLLANVPSDSLHRDVVPRLTEERLRVLERLCELKIRQGLAASALAQLWDATRTHLGNERLAELLIEALYRTGRQADALAEYRRVKQFLAGELGVDPGPRLRRLELSILVGETWAEPDEPTGTSGLPELTGPAGTVAIAGVGATTEPAAAHPGIEAPQGFLGRSAIAGPLTSRLRAGAGIVVLTGPPGAGKTALARHLAAAVRDDFPGGQLLLDMRQADGTPVSADDLTGRLAAWPRPHPSAPGLLILDDVADVRQALATAPYWPAGDTVLLTSQFGLAGVVARFGGSIERVGGFDPAESVTLLAAILGSERVEAEPAAARALADLCDHLPLALRIAAARLLTRTASLAASVAWLHGNPIGRLALPGDPDMTLLGRLDRAVHRLPPPLVTALLSLGTLDPDPLDLAGVAHRLQVTPDAAETVLDQLADASLIEDQAGQFRIPGLLRRYARACASTTVDGRRSTAAAGATLSAV